MATKVIFNNKNYNIDETALASTMTALEEHLRSMAGGAEPESAIAGLYRSGTNYTELMTSWDDLIESGAIVVNDGAVSVGTILPDDLPEKNEYGFYYGVPYDLGGVGWVFYEDGSFDMYDGDQLMQSVPAGSAVYNMNSIDLSALDMPVLTVSADGKILSGGGFEIRLGTPVQLAGDLLLPDDGTIIAIGVTAFMTHIELTSVAIPDSVITIGTQAFYRCSGLINVDISNSITIIDDLAFALCERLTSVAIPASVTKIGLEAFDQCINLATVIFKGTMEQWNAISKGHQWNYSIPATYVQCSDGQVAL